MSRTLLATICLSTAMIGSESVVSEAGADDGIQSGQQPLFSIDQSGLFGPANTVTDDPNWLANMATANPQVNDADALPVGGRLSIQGGIGDGPAQPAAAAVLDFGVVDGGVAEPGYTRFRAAPIGQPDSVFAASLGTAVGFRFDAGTAGAFSNLNYARSIGGGSAGPEFGDESLTGSVGLQSTARFDTAMGAMEPQFRLSLDHDFDIGDGVGGPLSDQGRQNIYIEERDVTHFDLDNAISLRMKGIVPGWFHYETRVRVRLSGIREVSGRIRFKW